MTEKLKLLVVDDEPDVLRALTTTLREHYEISTAADPMEAIQLVMDTPFAVVVSDHRMPEANGVELLHAISETRPSTRRILMSGLPPPDLDAQVARGVVHVFLPKPAGTAAIIAAIESALKM